MLHPRQKYKNTCKKGVVYDVFAVLLSDNYLKNPFLMIYNHIGKTKFFRG